MQRLEVISTLLLRTWLDEVINVFVIKLRGLYEFIEDSQLYISDETRVHQLNRKLQVSFFFIIFKMDRKPLACPMLYIPR